MPKILLTHVRYTEEHSRALLTTFLFGGKFGAPHVPRGIEPEFVSRFIKENLHADAPPVYFAAVVEVLRFYERADVLPQLWQALKGQESDGKDVLRSAYAIQGIGDLGTREEAAQAADYFDRFLAPHAAVTTGIFPVLFDTLIALAPAGSTAAMVQRLTAEGRTLAANQYQSESGRMQYDALAAVGRNNLPRANAAIEIKKRLAALSQDARRPELARIYLGLATGGNLVGVWAARLLRKEAMEGSPDPVYAEFAKGIEEVEESKVGKDRAHLIRVRAAQAIIYLQGIISPQQQKLVGEMMESRGNFLWDS